MSFNEGLQVAYDGAPELSMEEKIAIASQNSPVNPSNEILRQSHGDEGTHRRILQCGFRRTRIWIIAIVLLIIIVGAIGGGFGAMSRIKSEKFNTVFSTVQIPSTTSSSSSGSIFSSTAISSSILTNPSTSPISPTSTNFSSSDIVPAATIILSDSTSSSVKAPFPTNGILALDCPALNDTRVTPPNSQSKYEIYCGYDFQPITQSGAKNDLRVTQSLTLFKCLADCESYNQIHSIPICLGVSFDANLTYSIQKSAKGGNCFLKQDVSNPRPYSQHHLQVSGKLVT